MSQHLRQTLAIAAVAALTGGLLTVTAGSAIAAGSNVPGDFNGDGYRDIAVAAPGASVAGKSAAGQVVILWGGTTDPNNTRRTVISQDSPGVPGGAEAGDRFGDAIVAQDFDGDGYADLAVGTPGEDLGTDTDGGTVAILWGSDAGLTSGVTVADPAPASHDKFGRVLAALVDSDQKPDLAIGSDIPTIDVYRGGFTKAGGHGGGYRFVPPASVTGAPTTIASGNFGGEDLIADIVVTGASTYYALGSATGLHPASTVKLPTSTSVAIGDFDNNYYEDIALGAPNEGGGAVRVFHSDATGPSATVSYTVTQDSSNIPGTSEPGDRFGASLEVAASHGYGSQILAIGAPGESLGSATGTGAVTLVFGGEKGFDAIGADSSTSTRFFAQSTPNVPGNDETGDHFGSSLHLADTHNDLEWDLLVGVPDENAGDGAAVYFRGSNGPSATGTPGISASGTSVSTSGSPLFGVRLAG
ncbi:FG-GAP and VCBS repeat-containing protein [Streptomyces sp. LX-29]|uniref:FG-GAP repeat protein n=1 Tax=Streptomyces sp. LX-29 TaxID=2900152 RepID=UPI00240E141C|nr:FG-GAP and VCBS repeat-containing protein [Streptomyces sp. LX-29]